MRHLNLTGGNTVSYEYAVAKWRDAQVKVPFIGHFLYSFVTQSNQIENININYNSTRELFESEQLTGYTGDLRDVFSVLNNRRVAEYLNGLYHTRTPVTRELILETHRLLMFGSVDRHRYEDNGERAGEFKKHNYCVGRLSVGSIPEDVPKDIDDLCKLLVSMEGKDALKMATAFLCHFEYIHPFADGNGRVGRWLVNYLLVIHDHPPVLFRREDRQEYYGALEKFDAEESYDEMYKYLTQQVVHSFPALRELILKR